MKKIITIIFFIIMITILTILLLIYINKKNIYTNMQEQNIETITNIEEIESEQNLIENQEVGEIIEVTQNYTAADGNTYEIVALLSIPSLEIEYPVLSSASDELLKISLNKYWGTAPNTVGNFCVIGHNYNDERFFGKLDEIQNGDIIEITDMIGQTVEYSVYDTFLIDPSDTSCTSQLTEGRREITLITCNSTGSKRFIVKADEKK